MRWLRYLFLLVVRRNILIPAVHVLGMQNSAPDALSRGLPQQFRALRPDADFEPATWDWGAFAALQR